MTTVGASRSAARVPRGHDIHIGNDEHHSSSVALSDFSGASTPVRPGVATPNNKTVAATDPSTEPLILSKTGAKFPKGGTRSRDVHQSRISQSHSPQVLNWSLRSTWLPSSCTFNGLISDWWLWELSSWLLAAISIIVMIAVLGHYDNKVPPKLTYGATLNTLISVLTTALKVSLLFPVAEAIDQLKWLWFGTCNRQSDFGCFDEASRGPFGAVLLLARMKGRSVTRPHISNYRLVC